MNDRGSDMSKEKEKLLDCPFCGGKAEFDDEWRANHYGLDCPNVCCNKCGTRNYADTEEDAINHWNTRA